MEVLEIGSFRNDCNNIFKWFAQELVNKKCDRMCVSYAAVVKTVYCSDLNQGKKEHNKPLVKTKRLLSQTFR